MEIGDIIKTRRSELGMTQNDLADVIGLDARQLRRYENNEREPGLSLSTRIAEALHITLAELAGEPSQRVNLSGDWWACWQSWKDGVETLNAHEVRCEQRGEVIAIEAVTRGTEIEDGGYLWKGELRLWDNEIVMGWYVASEQAIRSKGTMYFTLHQHGQSARGRWVGLSYDGDIITGWASLAKTQADVNRIMTELKGTTPP